MLKKGPSASFSARKRPQRTPEGTPPALASPAALLSGLVEHPVKLDKVIMGQGWIDVRVQSSMDADELAGLLNDPWMIGVWQEDGMTHLYWPHERWTSETRQDLTAVVQRFGIDTASIEVHSLPYEDWNAAWARSVKPLRVGQRIVIRPSWEAAALKASDVELVLDPKQAFGTGHHATTQLLLEWLEAHIHGGERVLDVGTGSGILAMVALRLGAASAWGIDHDPIAIECAHDYAIENGFGMELTLDTSGLTDLSARQFDIVLANLDRRTLLDANDALASCLNRHSRLVLSGILADDRADLLHAFRQAGCDLVWEQERDGWLAMAFACRQKRRV
jgi:ribosomal protein L11 methyltransferase